ncbi:MAG TPA: type II toxin-antitoxin system HicA family toxin [Bdellovibrionota bacterium]|nr:type II toxin-antitoxin system HicA family toxin [Bdellovibrionota bacterium]
MATYDKLIRKLFQGTRLRYQEVKKILKHLGYRLARQKGSHEQWVKEGRTFTLVSSSKESPFYILDALKKVIENEKKK